MNFDKKGYYFIAPFFIVYLIFGLYPAINTFRLAFFQYDVGVQTDIFVGLQYISRAITDITLWDSIFTALKYWFFGALFTQITALAIAAVFTFFKIVGKHFFKSIFYIPSIVSTAVVATLFSLFMGFPAGFINNLLINLGIIDEPIYFLGNPIFIFFLVVFIHWWRGFGSTSIIATAGMTSVSDSLYEAAKIDGANFTKIFFSITVPLIWPTLTYLWLTGLIFGLQAFDIQFMLTGSTGGPNNIARTISMYIYQQAFEVGNVGYAAALSMIFFFVIVGLSIIMLKILKRGS